jgi:hypothetical protein
MGFAPGARLLGLLSPEIQCCPPSILLKALDVSKPSIRMTLSCAEAAESGEGCEAIRLNRLGRLVPPWVARLSTAAGLILLLLAACGRSTPPEIAGLPTLQPSPTPVVLPSSILETSPAAGAIVVQRERTGISVLIDTKLASHDEPTPWQALAGCVELLLDGTPLETTVRPYPARSGDVAVASAPVAPSLGNHRATIQVSASGCTPLEYDWEFLVTEESTIPGLPKGFWFVRPLPHSVLTRRAYREADLGGVNLLGMPGSVCVGLDAAYWFRMSGLRGFDEVVAAYGIIAIDGRAPSGDEANELWGVYTYDCVKVDLKPGPHTATAQVLKTSGESVLYRWGFTITKD